MQRNKYKENLIVNRLIKYNYGNSDIARKAKQLFSCDEIQRSDAVSLYNEAVTQHRINIKCVRVLSLMLLFTIPAALTAVLFSYAPIVKSMSIILSALLIHLLVHCYYYFRSISPYNEVACRAINNWLPVLLMYISMHILEEGKRNA